MPFQSGNPRFLPSPRPTLSHRDPISSRNRRSSVVILPTNPAPRLPSISASLSMKLLISKHLDPLIFPISLHHHVLLHSNSVEHKTRREHIHACAAPSRDPAKIPQLIANAHKPCLTSKSSEDVHTISLWEGVGWNMFRLITMQAERNVSDVMLDLLSSPLHLPHLTISLRTLKRAISRPFPRVPIPLGSPTLEK
jgi:hypothetical protein